jgi:hypothetical protein
MVKYLLGLFWGIILVCLLGCSIETPEIRGVVLDTETKRPVEGAWVHATIELNTKTVQGNVHNALSVDRPHTRTDKQGKFIVPSKRFKKPYPPLGFGTEVLAFRVGISTVDDKGGGVRYFGGYYKRDFGKGDGDLKEVLRRDAIELNIHIKPVERSESEYFHHLQSLYSYCLSGRFSVEAPAVEGGCDEWELDYVIAKHERFIKRLGEPKTMDQRIHYAGTMKQLAYLYKQKGDYVKALETFKKVKTFEEKRGVDLWLREFEYQIHELQLVIDKGKK